MSTSKPKLQAKTPDNTDVNTLAYTHDDILKNPERRRYAIIEYATTDISHPVHGGDDIARIHIVHWEDVDGHLETRTLAILDEAFIGRTGQRVRPEPGVSDTPLDLSAIGGITGGDEDEEEADAAAGTEPVVAA